MAILKKISLVFVMIFTFSCSQTVDQNKTTDSNNNIFEENVKLGTVEKLNGEAVDLDQLVTEAVVLIFAADTCHTCIEEAKYWVKTLNNQIPKNIYFAHFMLGGNKLDANDWKDQNNIFWDIVIKQGDDLFRKYCPAIKTPCFLIKNNKTNQTVQTYDLLKKEDIERITGLWEY